MAYTDSINKNHSSTFNTLLAFGHTFINNQAIDVAKTITFPLGYDVTDTTSETSMEFKVVFTNGHNSTLVESTPTNMTLNNILIVVNQNGVLVPLPIHNINNTYKCLQPNTCLELYYTNNYDGNNTPAYVIIGNPIVLSGSDYIIYADGKLGNEPVGTLLTYYGSSAPYGYLSCDGSTFNQVIYPKLYTFLGSTTLPDYRECAIVGIGQNSTNVIINHDVYNVGQFKDDCIVEHGHETWSEIDYPPDSMAFVDTNDVSDGELGDTQTDRSYYFGGGRIEIPDDFIQFPKKLEHGVDVNVGNCTHGKQKGALICIKAM